MRSFFIAWILLLLTSSLSFSSSLGPRHVFLGLTEPASGLGILGHGFLIIDSEDDGLLSAQVYTYAAGLNKNQRFRSVKAIVNVLPLTVEKSTFNGYYEYDVWSRKNTFIIYELDLTSDEVDKLQVKVEAEANDPDFSKRNFYGIDNSCITHIIGLVNSVVHPSKRIPISDLPSLSRPSTLSTYFHPGTFLMKFPYYSIAHLQDLPITKKNSRDVFPAERTEQIAAFLTLNQNVEELAVKCSWSEEKARIVNRYLRFYSQSPKTFPINALERNAEKKCPHKSKDLLSSLETAYKNDARRR